MELKKLIKLLYPPIWLVVLLTLICTAALVFIFIEGYEEHFLSYFVYVISFYTLTAIVMRCIKSVPGQYKAVKKKIYSNPTGEKLMTDMEYRAHILLYGSLVANLLYVTLNIVSGILYKSAWFYVLAFYYTILAVMRFLLIRFINKTGVGKNRFKELRRSRLCGYILLTVNLALSGAVLMILYRNKGYQYNGILIYVMALYTFWITYSAIKNIISYKKLGSPVMSMAKYINLAAALVSMLALETAMFSQFGESMTEDDQRLMIALTGGGVSIIIITISVYSIIKNSREIKKIMEKESYGE